MKRKTARPAFWRNNAAKQAQRRYLKDGKTQRDRTEEAEKATAEVFAICILAALYDKYGVGESRLNKVGDATNELAMKYEAIKNGPPRILNGKKVTPYQAAECMLDEKTRGYFPEGFVLPAYKMPRKSEVVKLAAQRAAAARVARLYAYGVHTALGFGAERIKATMLEAAENYRQFRDATDTGDYYGYAILAKKMSQIIHADCDVVEEGEEKPIFGNAIY